MEDCECRNKMKKKYDTDGTILKSNIKIVEINSETKVTKYICLFVSFMIIDVMLIFL